MLLTEDELIFDNSCTVFSNTLGFPPAEKASVLNNSRWLSRDVCKGASACWL